VTGSDEAFDGVHRTSRHQDFGDGGPAFRLDREYYWECTCGVRSANDESRNRLDQARAQHERESNGA
jgi:hypothetical protein